MVQIAVFYSKFSPGFVYVRYQQQTHRAITKESFIDACENIFQVNSNAIFDYSDIVNRTLYWYYEKNSFVNATSNLHNMYCKKLHAST